MCVRERERERKREKERVRERVISIHPYTNSLSNTKINRLGIILTKMLRLDLIPVMILLLI